MLRIIFTLLIFRTALSDNIYERIGGKVIENTGLAESLFGQIKSEVSKVIDQTAYEKIIQEYPHFKQPGDYTYIQHSSAFKSVRKDLVQFANQVLHLYRPLAIWILLNPKIGPFKVTPRKGAVNSMEQLTSKAGQISDAAAHKGSNVWTKLKNFFSKAGPNVMHALKKRSDQSAILKQVDNLIREQYYYQLHSPPLSLKEKLLYGWKSVIRVVSSQHAQQLMKRDLMNRSIKVFAQRLVTALQRALTLRSVSKALLNKFY